MEDPDGFELSAFYEEFPRVEEAFRTALDESLSPRGPELLVDLVEAMRLPPDALVVDVGAGEGGYALRLARQFEFRVIGIDPVIRHCELAGRALRAEVGEHPGMLQRAGVAAGTAEALPVATAAVDLVWCRDVLVHMRDLAGAYAQFRRVLRPGGRLLVYQMFATERLEPREAAWLFRVMGVVHSSADPRTTETAIIDAGLRIDAVHHLATEWGEYAEEHSATPGRHLLRAARLSRDPGRYIARFGRAAYEVMLGDSLWHVYRMIGKLSPRIYLLSRADSHK